MNVNMGQPRFEILLWPWTSMIKKKIQSWVKFLKILTINKTIHFTTEMFCTIFAHSLKCSLHSVVQLVNKNRTQGLIYTNRSPWISLAVLNWVFFHKKTIFATDFSAVIKWNKLSTTQHMHDLLLQILHSDLFRKTCYTISKLLFKSINCFLSFFLSIVPVVFLPLVSSNRGKFSDIPPKTDLYETIGSVIFCILLEIRGSQNPAKLSSCSHN